MTEPTQPFLPEGTIMFLFLLCGLLGGLVTGLFTEIRFGRASLKLFALAGALAGAFVMSMSIENMRHATTLRMVAGWLAALLAMPVLAIAVRLFVALVRVVSFGGLAGMVYALLVMFRRAERWDSLAMNAVAQFFRDRAQRRAPRPQRRSPLRIQPLATDIDYTRDYGEPGHADRRLLSQ